MTRKLSFINWISFLICIILVISTGLNVAATPGSSPFQDEVDSLRLLQVLPNDFEPAKEVSYHEYMTLIEKLFNGRRDKPKYNLTEEIPIPEGKITYADALAVGGMFLGYKKRSSINEVKKMTKSIRKSSNEPINGFEMAYIFHQLLYTNRVGAKKTVIEEAYLMGDSKISSSKIMMVDRKNILLEDGGAQTFASQVQVFHRLGNKIYPTGFSDIAVGLRDVELYFNNKKQIETVLLPQNIYPSKIRVLLSRGLDKLGGSISYDFKELKIKGNQPYKVVVRKNGKYEVVVVAETGKTVSYRYQDGGIKVSIGNYSEVFEQRVYLTSYYDHNISFDALVSTQRQKDVPLYAGTLEITPSQKKGYLYLINELELEDYIKKVIPGQIPDSWPEESFKVQAIAARSYALAQVSRGKFNDKSANLDDSTSSQLYNYRHENEKVNRAVEATRGMVATHRGHIIDAVYFSTSAGYTANNESVWHSSRDKSFPGDPIPYLRARSQLTDKTAPDLTNEKNALAFYKNTKIKSYDVQSSFYRWRIELNREELENTINKNLPRRERADLLLGTDFVKTISGTPVPTSNQDFSIGKLKDLRVVERGQGGNMMVLEIVGTNGTYRVMKEYNIRFIIRPRQDMTGSKEDVIVQCYNGRKVKNYSILPSAFAAFDIKKDSNGDIKLVKIYGGGNGHGVGLSQWGMKEMAQRGYTYKEILKHYYKGIEIRKIIN